MNNISRNSYCWFGNHNIHLTTNPLKASRTGPPFTIGNSCGWHEFTQKQYYSIFNIRCQGWLAGWLLWSNPTPHLVKTFLQTGKGGGWFEYLHCDVSWLLACSSFVHALRTDTSRFKWSANKPSLKHQRRRQDAKNSGSALLYKVAQCRNYVNWRGWRGRKCVGFVSGCNR